MMESLCVTSRIIAIFRFECTNLSDTDYTHPRTETHFASQCFSLIVSSTQLLWESPIKGPRLMRIADQEKTRPYPAISNQARSQSVFRLKLNVPVQR